MMLRRIRRRFSTSTLPSTNHSQASRPLKAHKEANLPCHIDRKLTKLLPDLNYETFSDHLIIPRLGWQSLFSAEPRKHTPSCPMLYKQFLPGSLAAHHYPLGILPQEHSARIPGDLYVTPYTLDEINYTTANGKRIRQSLSPGVKINGQVPLLHTVYDNVCVVVVFSGQPPSADSYAALQWKEAVKSQVKTLLVLYSPASMPLKWLSMRYVKIIASGVVESAPFYSLTTKLGVQNTIDLHQYREQLPSVLLVDRKGYIRWHAVGKPTSEALALLQYAIGKAENS